MAKNKQQIDNFSYIEKDLNDESLYNIKNICFLCGLEIKNDFSYFQRYGNCCMECSARTARVAGKDRFYPDRIEKAHKSLAKRREDVKNGLIKKQGI